MPFLQTFGDTFASDGRLEGMENIQTVSCSSGTCSIVVPAPSAALVFLTSSSTSSSQSSLGNTGGPSTTFSTTFLTKTAGTATIDPSVLATSNGHTGMDAKSELGSTSHGSFSNGALGMMTYLNLQLRGLVIMFVSTYGLVGWVLFVL